MAITADTLNTKSARSMMLRQNLWNWLVTTLYVDVPAHSQQMSKPTDLRLSCV